MSYQILLSIKDLDFSKKTVLIIGAGWMAEQYCVALEHMGINNVCVVSNSEKSAKKCCEKFGFRPYYGGYAQCLPNLGTFDLVIVATPVDELAPAALAAIRNGNANILVEKPGALYPERLVRLEKESEQAKAKVRIAYNRLTYPSYWKLKQLVEQDGGSTSCRYTFTELIRSIDFQKDSEDTYRRWGIANSLHVISMAHSIIGMPKELTVYQLGRLAWHPSGSRFVGAGITNADIPFSYHADWDSAGRWGIEIMTREYAYRLIPLEKLFRCRRGSFDWEPVEFEASFDDVKEGVAEQVAIMLGPELETHIPLLDLHNAAKLLSFAEKVFGYSKSS